MSNDASHALEASKREMRRQFWKLALFILVAVSAIWLWLFSFPRPTALYEKWIGTPVPEDVTNLEGSYSPWSVDPNGRLSFECPEKRIESIVKEKGMFEVVPSSAWHQGSPKSITIDGKETSDAFAWGSPHSPEDQKVYWIGANGSSFPVLDGWALLYSPSSKQAILRRY